MTSLAKRPDGVWRARYFDAEGKERSRHFQKQKDAKDWLDEQTTSLRRGDWIDPKAGDLRGLLRPVGRAAGVGRRDGEGHEPGRGVGALR